MNASHWFILLTKRSSIQMLAKCLRRRRTFGFLAIWFGITMQSFRWVMCINTQINSKQSKVWICLWCSIILNIRVHRTPFTIWLTICWPLSRSPQSNVAKRFLSRISVKIRCKPLTATKSERNNWTFLRPALDTFANAICAVDAKQRQRSRRNFETIAAIDTLASGALNERMANGR